MIQGSGTKQDYISGAKAKRDAVGLYLRYYYMRTYGFQASWSHDFKYEYTSPSGVTSDFGHVNSKNLVLLWSPAMNFSVHLNYSFSQPNAVYNIEGSTTPLSPTNSSSWNLGFEYNF